MMALFRLTGAAEPLATAQGAPAGIERQIRVACSTVEAVRPELLWSGTTADANLDKAILRALAHPREGSPVFLYDDSATPQTRIVRIGA